MSPILTLTEFCNNIVKIEALQTLKKDSNVMILPADKGKATVILNNADYKTKCQDILNDTITYKQLKKGPTNIYRRKLINLLKELKNSGAITQEQYYKVYPTANEPPKLYGLPKVHKPINHPALSHT